MSKTAPTLHTSPGVPLPLGATPYRNGVCFSLLSRHATSVTLVLFQGEEQDSPSCEITLDPVRNKTGDIWHIWVEGIGEGQYYGYRIDGPYSPEMGHRYNRNKLIVDPYARAISNNFTWDLTMCRGYDPGDPEEDLSFSTLDSAPYTPRSIVVADNGDFSCTQLNIAPEKTVIYELHVKGFTRHESSGTRHPGTFRGLVEKIPYLKDLGITAVELMPVQEFDERENININPESGERLTNYWGYSTLCFFAPKGNYSFKRDRGAQVTEFREMVKAFHDAGIEVILDVVFNHTAEGDQKGPTVTFRGIDNSIYYILQEDRRLYRNFSGCGNTVNCNHPLVRDLILDSLRYWVIQMHVDGFRFDLASILGRDQDGTILSNPPILRRIEEDPILRNTKIIAEAWDAAGAYQVGNFPGRWAEWNGKFRDDVRRFWRGDRGSAGDFATRITGSSDLYGKSEVGPLRGINFITCHDGFTLADLVSYREKHNLANGEENRDGENYNLSCNFGIEGDPATPYIDRLRNRQIRNMIATLFLSQGIPMLLSGDEMRRSQGGNNNTYCQDNLLSWIDWDTRAKNGEIFRFTRQMIRFREKHPILRRKRFFTGSAAEGFATPDVTWHGYDAGPYDWESGECSVCMLISGDYALLDEDEPDRDIYVIFNASLISRYYYIPDPPGGGPWRVAADTANDSPGDIFEPGEEPPLMDGRYYVRKLSTVILFTGD
ncbi:MAG: glycogen debranching protein GlgX [Spirochaetes bacterium]|nr:glycogen debranching protein GlgX [Spirochaetota bacterium]